MPDVRQRFANSSITPIGGTPEPFTRLVRNEVTKWGKVVRAPGALME